MNICIFISSFIPSYKSGGPVRSVANLVKYLPDGSNCSIFTRDRDATDEQAFPNIGAKKRLSDKVTIFYYFMGGIFQWCLNIYNFVKSHNSEYVFLNSFFDLRFSILPLLVCRIFFREKIVILAPRGEFSPNALNFSRAKKIFYIVFHKAILSDKIRFLATTDDEARLIRSVIGEKTSIVICPNIPDDLGFAPFQNQQVSKIQKLELLFLGRISRDKNVHLMLEYLADFEGYVSLRLVGAFRDPEYLLSLKTMAKSLPTNITVSFEGPMPRHAIQDVFKTAHLSVLLSCGENFGHSIAESLSVGRCVLASDFVGFSELARHGCGANVSIEGPAEFLDVLEHYSKLSARQWHGKARKCRLYFEKMRARNVDAVAQCLENGLKPNFEKNAV